MRDVIFVDLYITTLGVFDLKVKDESIAQDFGRSYRIIKLLHYFLTFKNKKLLPESIIDNLYQDSQSFDPKNMLRAQIYRLRQSLKKLVPEGQEERDYISIIFSNGYYSLELGKKIILDVDLFEDLIRDGDNIREKDINKAIEIYKRAINLYKGNYLEESSYEIWLVPIRNYYNRIYIKTLFNLLDLLKEKNEYESIIEICEEAIQYISEEEGIHIYLMESMLKLGQIKNALSYYEFIFPSFSNEIANTLSPRMKNIYKKIQSHFNENKKLEIGEIELKLEEENETGPLYCNMDYFKFIFSSQKRKRKYGEERDYISLISLDSNIYDKEEIKKWSKIVRNALDKTLRKGDIYTFWNDTQVLVLLSNVKEGGLASIESRLRLKLKVDNKYDTKIKCTNISVEELPVGISSN